MAKFYAMGNYTAKAFEGFIKDPNTDRSKAAQAAGNAVGAKMISYDALRGSFDFIVVFEGSFEQMAGIKLEKEVFKWQSFIVWVITLPTHFKVF